jgi:hypothetical protein
MLRTNEDGDKFELNSSLSTWAHSTRDKLEVPADI